MKKTKLYNLQLTYDELDLIYDLCMSKFLEYDHILQSNSEDEDSNVGCIKISPILTKIESFYKEFGYL